MAWALHRRRIIAPTTSLVLVATLLVWAGRTCSRIWCCRAAGWISERRNPQMQSVSLALILVLAFAVLALGIWFVCQRVRRLAGQLGLEKRINQISAGCEHVTPPRTGGAPSAIR
jgi:hypothetical protein